ncbi:HD domain-containing protein [Jutongia sp.]
MKVYTFAKMIGEKEKLPAEEQFILETAAIVHDIGIKPAEEKFGQCGGKLQEQEGPAVAEKMLKDLGYPDKVITRVCYLVGHHHTYDGIDGMDYQILVEADFLVNLHEDGVSGEAVKRAGEKIFRTESGRDILETMFQK